jgi:hypothetical protein
MELMFIRRFFHRDVFVNYPYPKGIGASKEA